MTDSKIQDLEIYRLPPGFRGKSAVYVQLWWIVQALLFHPSPQVLYGWRRWLLRLFGAQVGGNVLLRPSMTVTYPWKVSIGKNAWIGDDVVLYSLGPIEIGDNAVVSQGAYICTGTHDYRDPSFPISGRKILIEAEAWVAARAFIGPGITVGRGAVVAACSVVTKDVPAMTIVGGHPARTLGPRLP